MNGSYIKTAISMMVENVLVSGIVATLILQLASWPMFLYFGLGLLVTAVLAKSRISRMRARNTAKFYPGVILLDTLFWPAVIVRNIKQSFKHDISQTAEH